MANIYIKLGLDVLPPRKRRERLHKVYCPALREMKLPPGPKDKPEEPDPALYPIIKIVEDDEKTLVSRVQQQVIDIDDRGWLPPPPPPPKPRRLRWLLTGMVLGALLVVAIMRAFWPFLRPGEPLSEAPTTPGPPEASPPPVIVTYEVTREVTRKAKVGVVATPTPAPLLPTPEPSILFFDDFEDGPDPAWEIVSGDITVVNGRLTTNDGAVLLVGDASWTNYSVEFRAWTASWEWYNRALIRVQDLSSSIQLAWGETSIWMITDGGAEREVPHSQSSEHIREDSLVRLTVEGDRYRAYVNGVKASELINPDFPSGRAGVILYRSCQIDDFTVSLIQE